MATAESAADGVTLRPLVSADLDGAYALTMELRWPHRLEDWQFAAAHGRGVVAERDGKLVGTALLWRWGEHLATLGLVVVAPAVQGRRIGQRLMQALLASERSDRAIVLHATAEGRGLYERLGFAITGEIRQHQGIATTAPLLALPEGQRLRPLGRNDAPRLIQLDARACGMPRPGVLHALFDDAETVVLDRDGEAVGFSVLRRFGRGHAIGPVVAPDAQSAQALMAHWCSLYAGKFIRIDVDANSGLIEWLESIGLQRVGMATIMQRGTVPPRGIAMGSWALINQAMG